MKVTINKISGNVSGGFVCLTNQNDIKYVDNFSTGYIKDLPTAPFKNVQGIAGNTQNGPLIYSDKSQNG